MSQPISATELRANIYRVLDRIVETGEPQEVTRKGARFLIMRQGGVRRLNLDGLPKRRATNCTADELVETSWESEWSPD